MTDDTLCQALAYAARGWPVFPCQPGQKIPATTHGCRNATTDPGQIIVWFALRPECNLAIATRAPGPRRPGRRPARPAGNGFAALIKLRDAGLLTGAAAYVRTPAAECTPISSAHTSATAICPPATSTSSPRSGTSWPRRQRSAARLTGSCGNSTAAAA
jgi:bifunctional DNA primase/polymerase-like protein